MSRNIHLTTAILLTLAALLHLLRIILGWDLVMNNWLVPVWLSGLLVILAGYLGVHFWKNLK